MSDEIYDAVLSAVSASMSHGCSQPRTQIATPVRCSPSTQTEKIVDYWFLREVAAKLIDRPSKIVWADCLPDQCSVMEQAYIEITKCLGSAASRDGFRQSTIFY